MDERTHPSAVAAAAVRESAPPVIEGEDYDTWRRMLLIACGYGRGFGVSLNSIHPWRTQFVSAHVPARYAEALLRFMGSVGHSGRLSSGGERGPVDYIERPGAAAPTRRAVPGSESVLLCLWRTDLLRSSGGQRVTPPPYAPPPFALLPGIGETTPVVPVLEEAQPPVTMPSLPNPPAILEGVIEAAWREAWEDTAGADEEERRRWAEENGEAGQ